MVLFLLRFLRGTLLVLSAAFVAMLLLLLGSRVVRKRTIPGNGRPDIGGRADIGGRPDIGSRSDHGRRSEVGGSPGERALHKAYDPALVVDAEYEEID
jgi:hypothetical protein